MPIISHAPPGLRRARVLVAEDEPVIALDLASAVEEAGGCVVGPAASVQQALRLVATDGGICAAILDVDLLDGDVGPVIEELVRRAVPVIIHTGGGLPATLLARFRDVEVHRKPTPSDVLVSRLAGRLGH